MVAKVFLALGFLFVAIVMLFVEPGMGFAGPADFFDPVKVLRGAATVVWAVEDVIYLGFGIALVYLALRSDDRWLRAAGIAAGVLLVLVANLSRVLALLPGYIDDPVRLDAAASGLLPVRFAALRTGVLALGLFAWRTTRGPADGGREAGLWRGFGYLVLVGAAAFNFVFFPVPLLFTIWAVWYAIRPARPLQPA